MKIIKVHQRRFEATVERVGALLDSRAWVYEALLPNHSQPRMELDRPLGICVKAGHGPIGDRNNITFKFLQSRIHLIERSGLPYHFNQRADIPCVC